MICGYARVSTNGQLNTNLADLTGTQPQPTQENDSGFGI
jgi:hypothetical protein